MLTLEELAETFSLVDATELNVSRRSENETQKTYYSGKKKQFTFNTQMVADEYYYIHAISESDQRLRVSLAIRIAPTNTIQSPNSHLPIL